MTRTIFSSSAISSALFCSRPAVSMRSTSAPAFVASASASKARPAASAPGARAMTGAPARSPQIFSCSIAAARKVSPAASMTLRPSARKLGGELADGRGLAGAVDADDQDDEAASASASMTSGCATGASTFSTSPARTARTSSGADLLVERARREARRRCAPRSSTPRSAWISSILEVVERLRVELALGEDVGDAVGERLRGARQARTSAAATSRRGGRLGADGGGGEVGGGR